MNIDTNEVLMGVINVWASPVVICDLNYRITFMNKSAEKRYENLGGGDIVGTLLSRYFDTEAMSRVEMAVEWFKEDKKNNIIFCEHDEKTNEDVYIVAIRNSNGELICFGGAYYCRTHETRQAYHID